MYYQNVRGLRTKTNTLQKVLSSCDYDVIAFTETWLHTNILNSELSADYTIYRTDRNRQTSDRQRGGGVLIAVKNSDLLHCKPEVLPGYENLEQIVVRASLPSHSIYICCIYIRPGSPPDTFREHATCVQIICDMAASSDTIVVVGDYNLPNLNWSFDSDINGYLPTNASAEQEIVLVESLLATGLQQIFNLLNCNHRLLDLAFVSDARNVELIEPASPILKLDPHHRPFVLILDAVLPPSRRCSESLIYDFNRCNFDLINRTLSQINWNAVLNTVSVDEAVSRFYDALSDTIHLYTPLRRKHPPTNRKPWWNNSLRNLRNRLRKARTRFFKRNCERTFQAVRELEELYESQQNAAFCEYIHNVEKDVKQNPHFF